MSDFWMVDTEGNLKKTELTNKEFLVKTPMGGFTTMKCCNYGNMFHLDRHIERLRFSFNGTSGQNLDFETVRGMVMEQLKKFEPMCCNWEAWRVTILFYAQKDGDDPKKPLMMTHVMPIPDKYPNQSVTVDIVDGDRLKHGEIKSTYWVVERQSILDARHENSDEAFLLEKDGTVREGCLSNLFVMKKGTVYTSNEIIVMGTVRDVCIKALKKENIPVVFENPKMKNVLEDWDECWYTSQTKGCYTIREIWYQGKVLKKFPEDFGKKVQDFTIEHAKNFWTKVWKKKE